MLVYLQASDVAGRRTPEAVPAVPVGETSIELMRENSQGIFRPRFRLPAMYLCIFETPTQPDLDMGLPGWIDEYFELIVSEPGIAGTGLICYLFSVLACCGLAYNITTARDIEYVTEIADVPLSGASTPTFRGPDFTISQSRSDRWGYRDASEAPWKGRGGRKKARHEIWSRGLLSTLECSQRKEEN